MSANLADLFFELKYSGGPISIIFNFLTLDDLMNTGFVCRVLFEAAKVYLKNSDREYDNEEVMAYLLSDRIVLEPLFYSLLQNKKNHEHFRKMIPEVEEIVNQQINAALELGEDLSQFFSEDNNIRSKSGLVLETSDLFDLSRFQEVVFTLAYCLHHGFTVSFKYVFANFCREYFMRSPRLMGTVLNFVSCYHSDTSFNILSWLLEDQKLEFEPVTDDSTSYHEGDIFHSILPGKGYEKKTIYCVKSCVKFKDVNSLNLFLKFPKFRRIRVKTERVIQDLEVFKVFMKYHYDINLDYMKIVTKLFTLSLSGPFEEEVEVPKLEEEDDDDSDLYGPKTKSDEEVYFFNNDKHVQMLLLLIKKSETNPEIANSVLSILTSLSHLQREDIKHPTMMDTLILQKQELKMIFSPGDEIHFLISRVMDKNSWLYKRLKEKILPEYIIKSLEYEDQIEKNFEIEILKNSKLKSTIVLTPEEKRKEEFQLLDDDVFDEPYEKRDERIRKQQQRQLDSQFYNRRRFHHDEVSYDFLYPSRNTTTTTTSKSKKDKKRGRIGILKNVLFGEETPDIFIQSMNRYISSYSQVEHSFQYIPQNQMNSLVENDEFEVIIFYFNVHNWMGLEYVSENVPLVKCLVDMSIMTESKKPIFLLVGELRQDAGKFYPPVITEKRGKEIAKKMKCDGGYVEVFRFINEMKGVERNESKVTSSSKRTMSKNEEEEDQNPQSLFINVGCMERIYELIDNLVERQFRKSSFF